MDDSDFSVWEVEMNDISDQFEALQYPLLNFVPAAEVSETLVTLMHKRLSEPPRRFPLCCDHCPRNSA